MTDDEFLHAFATASLRNDEFHHRDHLRLTWLMLRRQGVDAGGDAVARGIQRFAAAHGHGPRYHETMTRFWIWIVDHAMRARPELTSFEEFLGAFPMLLDTTLPYRHWTREAMMGPVARAAWVPPDRIPLPAP
ncbi:MAG TPA: hypothetical protein VET65_12005 [Candidatus Limnocylindrales bacterium]|nr:hypothetical protein [Candidatus Limnocylindrales bacterium]